MTFENYGLTFNSITALSNLVNFFLFKCSSMYHALFLCGRKSQMGVYSNVESEKFISSIIHSIKVYSLANVLSSLNALLQNTDRFIELIKRTRICHTNLNMILQEKETNSYDACQRSPYCVRTVCNTKYIYDLLCNSIQYTCKSTAMCM